MERTIIEKRITQVLLDIFPEVEYRALVASTAIIDILIAEGVITFDQPRINPDAPKGL